MKAVVYERKGMVRLTDVPMPTIREPRDAIVRVTRASICSSDLHIRNGGVPRAKEGVVLGHEFVGEIVETGAGVKRFQKGDRVAVNVESFCGECFYCRRGFVNNCVEGGWELGCRIDGGQAEFARVPTADMSCTRIPDSISDEQALFVGDVLATGYWAAGIGEIQPADVVLVLGAGPTGLTTMMSARLFGPAVIVAADVNESRLALAKAHGLCDITVNPKEQDVVEIVRSLTEGRGADVVFEVAGAKDTFSLAWQAARPNAVVVVVALYESAQFLPLHQMYGKNLTFKTGGVDAGKCAEIMRLIEAGRLDTSLMMTHRAPLNEIICGYEIFSGQKDGCIKWVVTPFEPEKPIPAVVF
ncbi:alcohol dehydrogenase [bioreactor metagenome]|uniref:Alcohol dehydrogenase n=1 Tax=bioreactor metagenome TaxID=1076179 RepID=A0A645C0B6_9ZZZZ|nr:alcohol dehydrogenase [Christensenella sp.]